MFNKIRLADRASGVSTSIHAGSVRKNISSCTNHLRLAFPLFCVPTPIFQFFFYHLISPDIFVFILQQANTVP